MPRAGTNHVTSVASGWLLRRDAKPVTVNVPFGVQVLPERLLVASSSQFNPRKPAPGELRNGPVVCALAFGPVHVSVTGWSGSSRRTKISVMKVFGKSLLRCGREVDAVAAASRSVTCDRLFPVFGAASGRSIFSILFAAAIRSRSEPLRGIVGTLLVGCALVLGRVFTADFFAGVFLPDVVLLPLDLLRDLADEIALFISRQSARLDRRCKKDFRVVY
jgi:hypothetical protein